MRKETKAISLKKPGLKKLYPTRRVMTLTYSLYMVHSSREAARKLMPRTRIMKAPLAEKPLAWTQLVN
jgi:hypothetical protein